MSDRDKKDIHPNRSTSDMDESHSTMVIAKTGGVDQRHVDVTAMIRSLQRTEGVTDCFRRGLADCEMPDCAWREYCLSQQDGNSFKKDI